MAKPLAIVFQGQTVNFSLEKVDRTRLYGYVDTEVLDETGKRCELGTLAGDGHSIIGRGGAALVSLSHDGQWKMRAELKPVDPQGKVIEPVRSTFDAPVTLEKTATVDEYLSHNITSIYQVTPDDLNSKLLEELINGAIFQFPFSFRGGLEAHAGFLLLGSDGNVFLCVGVPTSIEFVGLQEIAAVVPVEEAASDDDEALDFSLV